MSWSVLLNHWSISHMKSQWRLRQIREIMRESRLIIWNLDDPVPPLCAALPVCGDALLIFCGSRQRLGALAPEEFEAAEEFLGRHPLSGIILRYA